MVGQALETRRWPLLKAPVSKTGDSRFESWLPRSLVLAWEAAIPPLERVCG